MRTLTPILLLGLLVSACDQDTAEAEITPTLMHSFEAITVGAGEEISELCQSWTLNNDETLYVSKIRQRNGGAWHHSNWFFVPEDVYDGPDGTWDCSERGFHTVQAALEGGSFFAQSTQTS